MAKFAYNNAKNTSTRHSHFPLNYRYNPQISFKKEADLYSKSPAVETLVSKLNNLMIIYQQNLFHT